MVTMEQVNRYFANINPIAQKIAFDISEIKSDYDHVWLTLNATQQDDIVNGKMLIPEITIRYNQNKLSAQHLKSVPRLIDDNKKRPTKCQKFNNYYKYDKKCLSTFTNQKVGLKIIHDENMGDYRDEHSFPFSYKTKSQINLCVIVRNTYVSRGNENNNGQLVNNSSIYVDNAPATIVKCKMDYYICKRELEDKPNLSLIRNKSTIQSTSLGDLKSNNAQLVSLTDSKENDSENDTKDQYPEECKLLPEVEIPKGFDFLSNW